MILLQILKPNYNLIGKGFCYSRVMKYMLDISSPKSTSSIYLTRSLGGLELSVDSTVVSRCSFVSDIKVSI